MLLRRLITAITLSILLAPCLSSQDKVEVFPLSEVKAGLRGVGRSVFQGDTVEEFQVEILGVMKNAMAPKRDVILARLSSNSLARTGVVAGMSGSPVYIDGKLLGAVALSFPFSKEPLAGITPIEQMLAGVPATPPNSRAETAATSPDFRLARVAGHSSDSDRLIPAEEAAPNWEKLSPGAESGASFAALRLPLSYGGFSRGVIESYAPIFRRMGFELAEGAALSGGKDADVPMGEPVPGSMISMLLVSGDLNMDVGCTVTLRRGNEIYACGHQVLLAGPAQIPFAPARVIVTVPSLSTSFKLGVPGPIVGTISQDRYSAIYGVIGPKPSLLPVHLLVNSSSSPKVEYNFEMVQEAMLSPLLLNMSVASALDQTERSIGPSTLEVSSRIRLNDGQAVEMKEAFSADVNTSAAAAAALSLQLSYLLSGGFPGLRVEGIDISVSSESKKRIASLEQVWLTQSEVRPGDHLEVTALLRTSSGEAIIQKIPVDIPESTTDKMLSLVVGSGATLDNLQFRLAPLGMAPRELHQLVRAMNRMRRNNRLYALLLAPQRSFTLQGDEYPSPPPSLVQTFMADPGVSTSGMYSGTSVVGDFETKPGPYVIRGQKMLLLKVKSPGN